MPAPLTLWLVVLAAAFVVQALGWAWVAAGLRRVRADAALLTGVDPAPLADSVDEAEETHEAGGLPISVIVAARDEAERLPALLRSLAAQTHRPFEVVVVDDRSADATAETVRRWAGRFPVPAAAGDGRGGRAGRRPGSRPKSTRSSAAPMPPPTPAWPSPTPTAAPAPSGWRRWPGGPPSAR